MNNVYKSFIVASSAIAFVLLSTAPTLAAVISSTFPSQPIYTGSVVDFTIQLNDVDTPPLSDLLLSFCDSSQVTVQDCIDNAEILFSDNDGYVQGSEFTFNDLGYEGEPLWSDYLVNTDSKKVAYKVWNDNNIFTGWVSDSPLTFTSTPPSTDKIIDTTAIQTITQQPLIDIQNIGWLGAIKGTAIFTFFVGMGYIFYIGKQAMR